jgi:tetratricopeptide (TPR) repeat protein
LQVIKLSPTEIIAYSKLGRVYHKLGREEEALKKFHEAILIPPRSGNDDELGNDEDYYGLGIAYYNLGLYELAIKNLREATSILPNFVYRMELAKAYIKGRKLNEAFGTIIKMLYQSDEDDKKALKELSALCLLLSASLLKDPLKEIICLELAMLLTPDDAIAESITKLNSSNENLALAYKRLVKITQQGPKITEGILNSYRTKAALYHAREQEFNQAIEYLNDIIVDGRKVGIILVQKGRTVDVINIQREWLELNERIGDYFYSQGDYQQALRCYHEVQDKNDSQLASRIADTSLQLVKHKGQANSLALINKVLAQANLLGSGLIARAYLAKARAYHHLYELAIENYDRATELNPSYLDEFLQYCTDQLKKLPEAKIEDRAELIFQRGEIHSKLYKKELQINNHETALKHKEQAIDNYAAASALSKENYEYICQRQKDKLLNSDEAFKKLQETEKAHYELLKRELQIQRKQQADECEKISEQIDKNTGLIIECISQSKDDLAEYKKFMSEAVSPIIAEHTHNKEAQELRNNRLKAIERYDSLKRYYTKSVEYFGSFYIAARSLSSKIVKEKYNNIGKYSNWVSKLLTPFPGGVLLGFVLSEGGQTIEKADIDKRAEKIRGISNSLDKIHKIGEFLAIKLVIFKRQKLEEQALQKIDEVACNDLNSLINAMVKQDYKQQASLTDEHNEEQIADKLLDLLGITNVDDKPLLDSINEEKIIDGVASTKPALNQNEEKVVEDDDAIPPVPAVAIQNDEKSNDENSSIEELMIKVKINNRYVPEIVSLIIKQKIFTIFCPAETHRKKSADHKCGFDVHSKEQRLCNAMLSVFQERGLHDYPDLDMELFTSGMAQAILKDIQKEPKPGDQNEILNERGIHANVAKKVEVVKIMIEDKMDKLLPHPKVHQPSLSNAGVVRIQADQNRE